MSSTQPGADPQGSHERLLVEAQGLVRPAQPGSEGGELPQRPHGAFFVPEPLQHLELLAGRFDRGLHRRRRVGLELGLGPREPAAREQPLVLRRPRRCLGLVEVLRSALSNSPSLASTTASSSCVERRDGWSAGRSCSARPSWPFAAWRSPRSLACSALRSRRAAARFGDRGSHVVERPELRAVAVRLLEVVADDLVQLDERGAVLLEPGRRSARAARPRTAFGSAS